MPKKSLIFIILLVGVTAIFIYFAVKSQQVSNNGSNQGATQLKTAPKTALLSFDPAVASLTTTTQQFTSNILVDTNNKPITGVQIELKYDPAVISNVAITPSQNSLLGPSSDVIVLFKTIDQKNGRVSYALGISPQAQAKQGAGVVATLSFTATNNASKSSIISFTEKSMVTSPDSTTSVLKDTTPLIVSF